LKIRFHKHLVPGRQNH